MARLCRAICEEHLAGLAPASARVVDDHLVPTAETGAVGLPRGPSGHVFGPVPERVSAFVARTEDLDRLRAELVEGLVATVGLTATPSAFGLHGRGGIGKTVLASELTRDHSRSGYGTRTLCHRC